MNIIYVHKYIVEVMAFETYLCSASICLLLSTIFHWFGCLSESCHQRLLKLDITGVALLVSGSFFPGVYYGFLCAPTVQNFYLSLTAVVLAIGLSVPWIDIKFRGHSIRPYILASLVVLGLMPFVHWIAITPDVYQIQLAHVSHILSIDC